MGGSRQPEKADGSAGHQQKSIKSHGPVAGTAPQDPRSPQRGAAGPPRAKSCLYGRGMHNWVNEVCTICDAKRRVKRNGQFQAKWSTPKDCNHEISYCDRQQLVCALCGKILGPAPPPEPQFGAPWPRFMENR